jgi:hypothetical protein
MRRIRLRPLPQFGVLCNNSTRVRRFSEPVYGGIRKPGITPHRDISFIRLSLFLGPRGAADHSQGTLGGALRKSPTTGVGQWDPYVIPNPGKLGKGDLSPHLLSLRAGVVGHRGSSNPKGSSEPSLNLCRYGCPVTTWYSIRIGHGPYRYV